MDPWHSQITILIDSQLIMVDWFQFLTELVLMSVINLEVGNHQECKIFLLLILIFLNLSAILMTFKDRINLPQFWCCCWCRHNVDIDVDANVDVLHFMSWPKLTCQYVHAVWWSYSFNVLFIQSYVLFISIVVIILYRKLLINYVQLHLALKIARFMISVP